MQIVIEIPKKIFEWINEYSECIKGFNGELIGIMVDAIKNGTPLPKHGRLIDADEVKKNHERWIGYIDEDMIVRLNIAVDKHIHTIIPADKEVEE